MGIIALAESATWSPATIIERSLVVVSTAAFHARVRGSVPGLGGLKETKLFLPHPRVKVSIVGSLRDREVACSASDRQGSNFESCVWRTVSSQSSHHPQEVLLAQFSLYVHKGGLNFILKKWFSLLFALFICTSIYFLFALNLFGFCVMMSLKPLLSLYFCELWYSEGKSGVVWFQMDDSAMLLQLAPSIRHECRAMLSLLKRYQWGFFSIVTSHQVGYDDFINNVRDLVDSDKGWVANKMKLVGLSAIFVHIQAKLSQGNLLRMVRWHCPPYTGFEIKPWRCEAECATSRSRRFPTILSFTSGWGINILFFSNRRDWETNPELRVKGSGANHHLRVPALVSGKKNPNVCRRHYSNGEPPTSLCTRLYISHFFVIIVTNCI